MKVNIGNYPKKVGDRKVKVEISDHDVWSLDHTLAYIIAPALKKLKEVKHGSPHVDDEDVPDKLKSTSCKKKKKNEWDTDSNWHKRWDWVMNEMIFAFETYNSDWEEKFWSGKHDIKFVPTEDKFKNPVTGEMETGYEMKRGPNDTFKCDWDARNKFEARIQNGIRLFAKYYQGLWD